MKLQFNVTSKSCLVCFTAPLLPSSAHFTPSFISVQELYKDRTALGEPTTTTASPSFTNTSVTMTVWQKSLCCATFPWTEITYDNIALFDTIFCQVLVWCFTWDTANSVLTDWHWFRQKDKSALLLLFRPIFLQQAHSWWTLILVTDVWVKALKRRLRWLVTQQQPGVVRSVYPLWWLACTCILWLPHIYRIPVSNFSPSSLC